MASPFVSLSHAEDADGNLFKHVEFIITSVWTDGEDNKWVGNGVFSVNLTSLVAEFRADIALMD